MKYNDGKDSYNSSVFDKFCISLSDFIIWGWDISTYEYKFSVLFRIDLVNVLSYLDKVINDLEWDEKDNVSKAILFLEDRISEKDDVSGKINETVRITGEEIMFLLISRNFNWKLEEESLNELTIHLINEVLLERYYNKDSTYLRDAVEWLCKEELEYLCKKVQEHKEWILTMKEDWFTWDHDKITVLLEDLISSND